MQSEIDIRRGKHIPQLDGLRGIAILMIILYHYFPTSVIMRYGWCGVDLFFVLSGFLIAGRLVPFINDSGILKKFFQNRVLRIFPLYFLFLTLFFSCWFIFTSNSTNNIFPFYSNHCWQFFLFFQNWVYINVPEMPVDYLNHFWSLAVEEQFYLFFPFLIVLVKKPKKIVLHLSILVLLIIIARCIYYSAISTTANFKAIYWNTFFRIDSLLTGSILYILLAYFKLSEFHLRIFKIAALISLLLLIFGVYFYRDYPMAYPFFDTIGFTILAILFSYLLFKTLDNKNKFLSAITSNKTIVFIGKISFGLYIFHWPIYLLGFVVINKISKAFNYSIDSLTTKAVNIPFSLVITFTICYFSFKYFESYFLKWKAPYLKSPQFKD